MPKNLLLIYSTIRHVIYMASINAEPVGNGDLFEGVSSPPP